MHIFIKMIHHLKCLYLFYSLYKYLSIPLIIILQSLLKSWVTFNYIRVFDLVHQLTLHCLHFYNSFLAFGYLNFQFEQDLPKMLYKVSLLNVNVSTKLFSIPKDYKSIPKDYNE